MSFSPFYLKEEIQKPSVQTPEVFHPHEKTEKTMIQIKCFEKEKCQSQRKKESKIAVIPWTNMNIIRLKFNIFQQ